MGQMVVVEKSSRILVVLWVRVMASAAT